MLPVFFTGSVICAGVEMHIDVERNKRFYAVAMSKGWEGLYVQMPQNQVKGDTLWLQSRDMVTAVNELRGILDGMGELEPTIYFVTIAKDRNSMSNDPRVARHFRIDDLGDYRRIAISPVGTWGKWPYSEDAKSFCEKVKVNRHVRQARWDKSALEVELNPSSVTHANRLKTLEELLRLHEVR